MAGILKEGLKVYKYLFFDSIDKRSDDMFLMQSVWQAVGIVLLYLYFVLSLGPRLMKNRPPMKIEFLIKAYNLAQIPLCIYLIERSLTLGWASKYKWFCQPVDFSDSPEALETVRAMWFFMMVKLFDLLDTIFFVLRKKSSQVTFLHVYHHAGIFFAAWIMTKFLPGGHGTFLGCINCFVHIIMYFYYFVTMQWPEFREKIWWKKYITQLQVVQFLIVIMHSLPVLVMKECNYSRFIAGLMVLQYSFMFLLFLDFYRKAYLMKTK